MMALPTHADLSLRDARLHRSRPIRPRLATPRRLPANEDRGGPSMRRGGPCDIGRTAHLIGTREETVCVLPRIWRVRLRGSGETVGVSEGGGGSAGADVELAQDVEDVALDRALADREAVGD